MTNRNNQTRSVRGYWVFVVRALLLVSIVALSAFRAFGDDKVVRTAFLQDYKPHAQKLQQFYAHAEARCVNTYYSPNEKQQRTRFQAKWSGSNYLLAPDDKIPGSVPEGSPKNIDTIDGRNSRYDFTLTPKENSKHLINNVSVFNAGKPTALCFLTAPIADYRFSKQSFSDMVVNDKIQFLEFQDSTWQNKPAKKLKVQLTHHYGNNMHQSAEMIVTYYFAPQEGWISRGIQAYAVNKPSSMSEEIHFYNKQEGTQFPDLIRNERWLKDPENPAKARLSSVTDITEFKPLKPYPESDFTLSAFGLPEPYGVVWKTGPPWYLWCILLGSAFLGLGWYFRRRVQRHDVRPLGPSPT